MRYIFVDEAGTSTHESVTVVLGLIANADKHVMLAEALVEEALGAVPQQYKDGFVFSAKQVFNDSNYQLGWGLTDRLNLLHTMMSIPKTVGMAICVSVKWRGTTDFSDIYGKLGLSPSQSDHLVTFALCLAVADRNIRKYAGPREVATVVAEDVPDMRKFLKQVPQAYKKQPKFLSQEDMRITVRDDEAGHILQNGDVRITRIRNSIHFVDKADDPIVQLADACAYGIRRYLSNEKFGIDFVRSILPAGEHDLRAFASPGGAECYWPKEQ